MAGSELSVARLRKLVHKEGFSAAQWREIGTQLELPSSALDEIEYAHPRSSTDCLIKMLAAWLKYDKNGTMEKFKKALNECHYIASVDRKKSCCRLGYTHIIVFIIGIAAFYMLRSYLYQPILNRSHLPPPLLSGYMENLKAIYKNQPEVPGIAMLWYNKTAIKFIPPVFQKYDLRQQSHFHESDELYFNELFQFTGLGQRILIQGRPGSGKTTLANRLTKEWLNQTDNSTIAKCPLLLRVTLKELRMERPSGENLSLSNILSMNSNIKQLGEVLDFLSEPKNVGNFCVIFDGLDEYPPAYNDSSNYIYKIINRQQLSPATVIVLSRPEAFKAFFQTSGTSGFQAYELIGFNNKGIMNYVTENIPDSKSLLTFLINFKNAQKLRQLCSSPLHLAMLVESFKINNEFPSSLTEAYQKSLSKAIQREIFERQPADVGCSVQLNDLSSLRECNQDLFQTLFNISKLAFNSFKPQSNLDTFTVYGIQVKLAQKHFPYYSNSEKYGLLYPHHFKNEYGVLVTKVSFPHYIFQEFWAAFYVANAKADIREFEDTIYLRSTFIYFICGMHSSNTTVVHQVFEMLHKTLYWPDLLNDYIMCGLESGHSIQSLADTYLRLHGNVLKMDHLLPYSLLDKNTQSFIKMIHHNITVMYFSQHSFSLRTFTENRMFPNLNNVTIRFIIAKLGVAIIYSNDFSDNIKLILSRKKLKFIDWTLPLDALFRKEFLDLLGGTELEMMSITVIGSIVGKVPRDSEIYANCNSPIRWESWTSRTLTPDALIAALKRFIGFFNISYSSANKQVLSIQCITPVLILDCNYVQDLFETFYKSSFYNITKTFTVLDTCQDTASNASHMHPPSFSNNIVVLIISKINESSRLLYLTSGIVFEDEHLDKETAQVCTSKQLHSYLHIT